MTSEPKSTDASGSSPTSWPSGDCKFVFQVDQKLPTLRKRVESSFEPSKIVEADADDGLGPYSAFHFRHPALAMVALLEYRASPVPGVQILVDSAVNLLRAGSVIRDVLKLVAAEIVWTNPEAVPSAGEVSKTPRPPARDTAPIRSFTKRRAEFVSLSTFVKVISPRIGIDSTTLSSDLAKMFESSRTSTVRVAGQRLKLRSYVHAVLQVERFARRKTRPLTRQFKISGVGLVYASKPFSVVLSTRVYRAVRVDWPALGMLTVVKVHGGHSSLREGRLLSLEGDSELSPQDFADRIKNARERREENFR